MSINITTPPQEKNLDPRILVIGVGGAGGNAVENMLRASMEGVEFIVANTDAQALRQSRVERKIQLGETITRGLGAGARPDVGRDAAEETMEEVCDHLRDANMVFVTAGMGGGTGTGAAPIIARAARAAGILTVGVVTKPFLFEGDNRMFLAEQGLEQMQQNVDTLIVIPNQNLFRVANESTTVVEAFKMVDDVLYSGVRCITDLMVKPGIINRDFADVRTVMSSMGKAVMGTGEAEGENRAVIAAEASIANPLLEDLSMRGASAILVNITIGPDATLAEWNMAAERIREEVDKSANILLGSSLDDALEGKIRVSVVAAGIDAGVATEARPLPDSILQSLSTVSATATAPANVSAVPEAEAHGDAGAAGDVETATDDAAADEAALPHDDTVLELGMVEADDDPHTVPVPPVPTAAEQALAQAQSLDEANAVPFAAAPAPEPRVAVLQAAEATAEARESTPPLFSGPSRIPPRPVPSLHPAADAVAAGAARAQRPAIAPVPASPQPAPVLQSPGPVAVTATAQPMPAATVAARKPSLFNRMTGLGIGMRDGDGAAGTAPDTAPESDLVGPGTAPDGQFAEDTLEIPTFLRRQAN